MALSIADELQLANDVIATIAVITAAVVGGITAIVGWKQTKAARQQVRHSLYEKRVEIFDAVLAVAKCHDRRTFGSHPDTVSPVGDAVAAARPLFPRARFLFDEPVVRYMEKILEAGDVAAEVPSRKDLGRHNEARAFLKKAETELPRMVHDELSLQE